MSNLLCLIRDGVGDGQLLAVKEQELADIKRSLARLPKMYVILSMIN